MSWERSLQRKMDELRAQGFTEFRAGETLEEWIKRMVAVLPDPWAGVKKALREHQDRRIQRWVDAHKVHSLTSSTKEDS